MRCNSEKFLKNILECKGLSEDRTREFYIAQSILQAIYKADTDNINFDAFTLDDIDMTRNLLFSVEYDTGYYRDEPINIYTSTDNEKKLNPIIHSEIVDGFCEIIRNLRSKPYATDLDFI